VVAACSLLAGACGGGDDDGDAAQGGDAQTTTSAVEDQGQAPAEPAGTLRMTSRFYPLSLDPQRDTNYKGAWFYPMYDSLTMQDAEGELQPWLATSWERPDPLTWRFKLRNDVTFHDGSPFDATVVKKNFERTKADKASPHAGVFNPMTEVVVVDPHTVDVKFSTPSPTFPLSMSNNAGMMVSGKAIDSGADLTRSPAGSGGWIWDPSASVPQQSESYNINPNYWNKDVVHVQRIVVVHINDNTARHNALESGQVDIVDDAQPGRRGDFEAKGFKTITFPVSFDSVHIFDRGGQLQPQLADPRVREAITWLIDREGYLEVIHNGEGSPAAGLFPPGSKWHDPALDDYRTVDVARAKELLEEAGYGDGFTLRVPSYASIDQKVGAIAQMLAPAGITVEAVQVQSGVIAAEYRQGKWAFGLGLPRSTHPYTMFADFVAPDSTYNPFKATDTEALVAKAEEAAALSDDEAKPLWDELQREILDLGIFFPLGHVGITSYLGETVRGDAHLGGDQPSPHPHGLWLNQP
jgi:peptide/nickel transport system substrate-binding protein